MYQHITDFDSLGGVTSTGTHSLNKWPSLRKGAASISASLLTSGQYIEQVFDSQISFIADAEQNAAYTHLRLFLACPGIVAPQRFIKPANFTFSVTLFLAGYKIIEWLLPATATDIDTFDFDLAPLIGNGDVAFDRVRITSLADNGVTLYLCGLYLTDNDVEHSMKQAIQEALDRKISPYLCTTDVRNDAGASVLVLPPGVPMRPDLYFSIGGDSYQCLGLDKTETATTVQVQNGEEGTTLLHQYPPGTPVFVIIPATYTDIADAENVYPVFYIQGSELPARDRLGSESSLHYPKGPYVKKPDGKYFVGVQTPDKAYKYQLAVNIYATTLDIANDMRKFLSSLFDEDSFINIAGEPCFYEFKGIDGIQEWDSIAAMPHAILRLELSFSENLSTMKYEPFGLAKKIDFAIIPFLLLRSSVAG